MKSERRCVKQKYMSEMEKEVRKYVYAGTVVAVSVGSILKRKK